MTKIPIFAILFISFATLIIVLWQRQPKMDQTPAEIKKEEAQKEATQEASPITPPDGSAVKTKTIELKGTTDKSNLVLLYSNDSSAVTKASDEGSFGKIIEMARGINLVKMVTLNEKLEQVDEKTLTYYYSDEDLGQTVVAGAVKSIFDSLVTLTTPQKGNVSIRTSKSTDFDVPKEEDVEEATREVDNIRIGDYVVTTGDKSDSNSLMAKTFRVLRLQQPTITKNYIIGTISSNVRQNIFSAKNDKDGKLVEVTLNKSTKIQKDEKDVKSTEITKDKKAIIFYTKDDDDNVVDLVYILP